MTGKADASQRLRVVLEFSRADQPRLFDDLNRFPKGMRRVNRLRFLAQDGLAYESMQAGGMPAVQRAAPAVRASEEKGNAGLTDDIFLHEPGS